MYYTFTVQEFHNKGHFYDISSLIGTLGHCHELQDPV